MVKCCHIDYLVILLSCWKENNSIFILSNWKLITFSQYKNTCCIILKLLSEIEKWVFWPNISTCSYNTPYKYLYPVHVAVSFGPDHKCLHVLFGLYPCIGSSRRKEIGSNSLYIFYFSVVIIAGFITRFLYNAYKLLHVSPLHV